MEDASNEQAHAHLLEEDAYEVEKQHRALSDGEQQAGLSQVIPPVDPPQALPAGVPKVDARWVVKILDVVLYCGPDELNRYNIQARCYKNTLLGLKMVNIECKSGMSADAVVPALLEQLGLLRSDQFDFAVIRDVYHLPNYSSYPWEELVYKNYCSTLSKPFKLCAEGFPERQLDGAVGNVAVSHSTVQFLVDNQDALDVTNYETWEEAIAGLLQKGSFQFHQFTMTEQSVEQKRLPFKPCINIRSFTERELQTAMRGITNKIKKQITEPLLESRRVVSCAAHLGTECSSKEAVPKYQCASPACTRWLCSKGVAETTSYCDKCLEKQFVTPTKIRKAGESCSYRGPFHYGDLKRCTQGIAECKNLACATCTTMNLAMSLCVLNNDSRICASCSEARLAIPSLYTHVFKDESKDDGLMVEMTTIEEDNDYLFAGLHNADTQCAVIAMVQAQNAVPPLREVTLTHNCSSPASCQASFIELVTRVKNQKALTPSASGPRPERTSLTRKAKGRSNVQCDNDAVARLTKQIKIKMFFDEAALRGLSEAEAKTKKSAVEKEQVDVSELVSKVFSGFCKEGSSRLQELTRYHSLQMNRCLTCEVEWSRTIAYQDVVVPVYLQDNYGNEAGTIDEAFEFSAKPTFCRNSCNDSECKGVDMASCSAPCGPVPQVLLLYFMFQKNRTAPFKVPFTYVLYMTGVRYDLRSLICHIGERKKTYGGLDGHYVNYSRRLGTLSKLERWYRFDDNETMQLEPNGNILPGDKPYFAYYVRLPAASENRPEGCFEQTSWRKPPPGNHPAQKRFLCVCCTLSTSTLTELPSHVVHAPCSSSPQGRTPRGRKNLCVFASLSPHRPLPFHLVCALSSSPTPPSVCMHPRLCVCIPSSSPTPPSVLLPLSSHRKRLRSLGPAREDR